MDLVRKVTLGRQPAKKIDSFKTGDTVSVFVKVREGEKERVQIFRGLVTKLQGSGMSRSFTVRKISSGVGVERTFPFLSPNVEDVRLEAQGKVRQSRLYYLRALRGKAAKVKSEIVTRKSEPKATAPEESMASTSEESIADT
jgi:large subunit ribosomal protein L19